MKQDISLVLSGGAARGFAHIGVIEELEKHNYNIKSIAGNSMGALVGAIYASGNLAEFKKWALTLEKKDVIKLLDPAIGSNGLLKGDKVFNRIRDFLPDCNIEDLDISFVAVAADLQDMKEVIFDKGNLTQAVRASISIPAVFTPVNYNGKVLVDGGVVNPIPLNRVKRFDNDILVASFVNAQIPVVKENTIEQEVKKNKFIQKINPKSQNTNSNSKTQKVNKISSVQLLNKSNDLLLYNLAIMNIEKYNPNMLINISHDTCNNYEFYKTKEIIEIGRAAAKQEITNRLSPNSLQPLERANF